MNNSFFDSNVPIKRHDTLTYVGNSLNVSFVAIQATADGWILLNKPKPKSCSCCQKTDIMNLFDNVEKCENLYKFTAYWEES